MAEAESGIRSVAPFLPMEARIADALPTGDGWQFEPKWDGFRCLAVKRGDDVALFAKSGKPLGRFFPEVVELIRGLDGDVILDGELVIPVGDTLDFNALQLRLHPAASRIRKLSRETPAHYVLFDMLRDAKGKSLLDEGLVKRRRALEAYLARHPHATALRLSPLTYDRAAAEGWLRQTGAALDGVVAKRVDDVYHPGERAMVKVKRIRSADCVVGGFRYGTDSDLVGSLLLGLYDSGGLLDHVGFTSGLSAEERPELTRRLERLRGGSGFTGNAPGGPSRWSTERSAEWVALKPELVVEVAYDQITGNRFRHGTRLLRWRPDKAPAQCTFDQLEREARPAELLRQLGK
jgi:ATP-dependent DNA ligase